MSDSAVDQLSAKIGLARGYWDVSGIWREPSLDDRRALLEGLGWPADNPATLAAAAERLDTEAWRRPLPTVQVVAADVPVVVPITLPAGEGARWLLEEEGGETLSGMLEPGDAEAVQAIDGVEFQRRSLTLPSLPAGYHRLSLPDLDVEMSLVAAPGHCFLPSPMDGGGRVWGVSIQLYSVRSARNWGIGDYTDLRELAVLAGRAGADLIGVNPLHARSLSRPQDCSPYSPVSRLALDTLAIDVEALPEFAASADARAMVSVPSFQSRLAALRDAAHVDYAAVTAIKLEALRPLYQEFEAGAPPARREAHDSYVAEGGEAVRHYAEFEALRAFHGGNIPWWEWPVDPPPNDPRLADEVGFQLWLQFVAAEQLRAASDAAHAAGMRIGIYSDLAVGAARDGAEAWAAPELASRVTVGAPPDAMSQQGQNWGIPAPDPRALAASGFAPFAALLRANMRHAGAIRIDHAMSLARLFIIPPGRDGAAGSYLAYPFEAMTRILALESQRQRCLVVGEDLGTVEQGFREAMAARDILSYKVLAFERFADGAFKSPAEYPWLALATAATHDVPPLAGQWNGTDIDIRARLGLVADIGAAQRDRLDERRRLLVLFDWQGVLPEPPPDAARPLDSTGPALQAIHRLIARSGATIAMVQIDDILGEAEPVNIPGTSGEYPNWRRKCALALEDPVFLERFAATSAIFAAERPRPASL